MNASYVRAETCLRMSRHKLWNARWSLGVMGIVTNPVPDGLRSLPCLPRLNFQPSHTRPATNLLIYLSWQKRMKFPLLMQQQEDLLFNIKSPDTKPNQILKKLDD